MPRWAEWTAVIAALVYALLFAHFQWGGPAAYVLALLPGVITYLVARSFLASVVVFLIPMYFVIGQATADRVHYQPFTWLDRAMPLWPEWIFVYATLYLCAFIVPLVVVRGSQLVERTLQAYLFVMLVSYVIFWFYPTVTPRVENQDVNGAAEWTLQLFYRLDQPYGCFPSLHVAYSAAGAFACCRVRPRLGRAMLAWTVLIAVSTIYTKQHFAVDAIAGGLLGIVAWALFLRTGVRR